MAALGRDGPLDGAIGLVVGALFAQKGRSYRA